MAYGTVKVDNVTFTYNSADATTTFSGFYASTTNNLTLSGTASAATFTGTTANFTNVNAQNISVTTITGTTASFTSGVFTSLSGTTHTITSGVFASGTAALPSISFVSDPNTGVFSPGADQLAVATNGVGRLFVNSSGQVGINGAPPAWASSSSISVNEAAFSPALSYVGGEGELTHNAYYDGAWKYSGTGYQASRIQLGVQGTISFLNTPTIGTAGGAITWQERLRITSAGLVGIGTSAPWTRTEIRSANVADGVAANTFATPPANLFVGSNSGFALNDGGSIALGGNTNSSSVYSAYGAISGRRSSALGYIYDGYLAFSTAASDTLQERMRITSGGLVGIGTTSPVSELDVNGRISAIAGTSGAPSFNCRTDTNTGINLPEGDRIQFIVGGNEAARIDASSRLLVGTSTARTSGGHTGSFQLEGTTFATATAAITTNSSDSNGAYLNFGKARGGSIGSTTIVQSGDVCGQIQFNGSDGTSLQNAALITAVVDGTPGANDMPGRLVFSTTADGAASPTERVRITSGGNLLVGTTTAGGRLAVASSNATISPIATTSVTGDTTYQAILVTKFDNDTTTSQNFIQFQVNNGGANCGRITANGANTAAFGSTSDIRLKNNIEDLPPQLQNILSLRPVEFDYIESEGGGHQIGFIAQEMQAIYPDVVNERGEDDMLMITGWSKTEARLVKALQEAVAKIETLEARLTAAGIA